MRGWIGDFGFGESFDWERFWRVLMGFGMDLGLRWRGLLVGLGLLVVERRFLVVFKGLEALREGFGGIGF